MARVPLLTCMHIHAVTCAIVCNLISENTVRANNRKYGLIHTRSTLRLWGSDVETSTRIRYGRPVCPTSMKATDRKVSIPKTILPINNCNKNKPRCFTYVCCFHKQNQVIVTLSLWLTHDLSKIHWMEFNDTCNKWFNILYYKIFSCVRPSHATYLITL